MALVSSSLQWHEAMLGLVGFPAATVAGVLLWQRLLPIGTPIRATGHAGLCANTGLAFALIAIPFTQDAALLFFGATLLLTALRGYAGCEIVAVSNWLLRRDDQVGCVVFSPVDAVEAQLAGKSRAD